MVGFFFAPTVVPIVGKM